MTIMYNGACKSSSSTEVRTQEHTEIVKIFKIQIECKYSYIFNTI